MIVNKPIGGKSSTQTSQQGQNKKKQTEHDIDLSSIGKLKKGVAVAVDANSDAWAVTNPPPAGYYSFSPTITKDGVKGIERQEGNPESMFFKVNLELKFHSQDSDIAGAVMFANLSTYIGRGKDLSTVLGIMLKSNKRPKTIPSPITDVDQLVYLQKWLGAQPLVYALVDWQVWSKNQQKTLIKGMENFPQDEDGKYMGTIEVDGETCNANMKVVKFVTQEEFKQVQEEIKTGGAGVTEEDIPTVVEEPKQIKNKPTPITQAPPTPTQRPKATSQPTQQVKNKPVVVPPPSLEMDEIEESGGTVESGDDEEISIEDFIADDGE